MKLKSNKENLGPSPWLLNYIHFISKSMGDCSGHQKGMCSKKSL